MSTADPIRQFHAGLSGKNAEPLEFGSPLYVPILQADPSKDPVLMLLERILLAESESVHLLTRFRGNGKSTELRRLKHYLEDEGCRVLLVNMADFILLTKPLEITDFLLSLLAALAEASTRHHGIDAVSESWWERIGKFLRSEVELSGLEAGLSGRCPRRSSSPPRCRWR